jgi:asparagine synthase (glutamine-hydrolysing)
LFEPHLQPKALSSFLSYGFVPEPYTFIDGVMQLPAAHAGFVKPLKIVLSVYWNANIRKDQPEQSLSDIKRLLASTVKQRMVSDVPVAAFLSGGIDSSAVVSLMRSDTDVKLSTYTVALEEQSLNEAEYAQTVADIYQTDHHCLKVKAQEVLAAIDGFFDAMDTPTVDGMNVYLITQQVAQKGVKVVMSGVGGDELFAGYPGFKQWSILKPWRNVLNVLGFKYILKGLMKLSRHKVLIQLDNWLTQPDAPALNAFYKAKRSVYKQSCLETVLTQPTATYPLNTNGNNETKFAVSDYSLMELNNYTREVLLKDMDQMGMAFGVELREPLLDLQLLESVLSIADKRKLKGHTNKPLLVNALGDFMPMSLIKRPKKGFTLDWDNWLRNDLKPMLDEAVKALSKTNLFKRKALEALQQKYQAKHPSVNWLQVWSLVVLHQWFKRHLPELINQ